MAHIVSVWNREVWPYSVVRELMKSMPSVRLWRALVNASAHCWMLWQSYAVQMHVISTAAVAMKDAVLTNGRGTHPRQWDSYVRSAAIDDGVSLC